MVKTKTSLNPVQLNADKQTPYLDIDSEKDPKTDAEIIKGKGVVIIDPQGGGVIGSNFPLRVELASDTSGSLLRPYVYSLNVEASNTVSGLAVIAAQYYHNLSTNALERVRTPTIWKSALIVNAGATVIWAAVAGKKHRVMGWRVTLVNGTTAAAASLCTLLDAAAATGIGVQVCGAALGAVATSSMIANESWQNGYLSAAVNTDWNINLSTALAVAGIFVQVWGTEE